MTRTAPRAAPLLSPPLRPHTLEALPTTTTTTPSPKTHIVPAGHGHAFHVQKGTRFRIIDLHGQQVVDMVAWAEPFPSPSPSLSPPTSSSPTTPPTTTISTPLTLPTEYVSMSNTRYHLSGVHPTLFEHLYTNASRPLLRLTADTCKSHDMTFMACHPEFYAELELLGHRSCASNIAEAVSLLKGAKMSHLQVPDPFNTFQNTPNYTLKPLGNSRAGDFVEWEVLGDALVGVSSCPFDSDGFNGGEVTDIAVVTGIIPEALSR